MEKRNFKGIWIPKEIWLSKDLTIQEKLMLVEIDSLDDELFGCYANNKYFADFFQFSNSRVSQIIKSLETKGYISIQYIYKGKEIERRYLRINRSMYPPLEYLTPLKNIKDPPLENAKDNNININNINKKENIYKRKSFTPPTLEEIEEYCKQRNNNVDAKKFFDYFEASEWVDSKGNKVKNWKQKVITWESYHNDKKVDINLPEWYGKEMSDKQMSKEQEDEISKMLEGFTDE